MWNIYNMSDEDVTKMDASIIDVTGKSEYAESKESEPIDKVGWFYYDSVGRNGDKEKAEDKKRSRGRERIPLLDFFHG